MGNIKDIIEILELAKEEIENNNENITATLDLQDLKSLKNLYELYQKEKEKNEELSIIKVGIKTLQTNFVNDDTYYVIGKRTFKNSDYKNLLDDYISKDKIEKKIKELEEDEKYYLKSNMLADDRATTRIIEKLQELLEGENDIRV